MCSLNVYFDTYPVKLQIFCWAHAKNRISKDISLAATLHHLRDRHAPQILYANTCNSTEPIAFKELCLLIREGDVWAVNIGEAQFSVEQCEHLIRSVKSGNVAFMFVDSIFVGPTVVRILKDIIRERRRATRQAQWLISTDKVQNKVIMKCKNMWWAPWSLGRNKCALAKYRT